MNRPNTPAWDPQSAIRDDPELLRLHDIAVERVYLKLRRVEQLALLVLGVTLGLWIADDHPHFWSARDLGHFFSEDYYPILAVLLLGIVYLVKKDPGLWWSSFVTVPKKIGLTNYLPHPLTRWVLIEHADKGPPKDRLLARKLFRTPAGALRFVKRNNLMSKRLRVMWVDGREYYRSCLSRRESPTLIDSSLERSRLLDNLKGDQPSIPRRESKSN